MAIRPGQRVQAAEALLHLVRPTPVWIEIQLPLAVANRYKPGMAVLVGTQPATLVSISPVAGGGQSVSARARLTTSPTTPLLPGTALEARLPSTGGAWRLPQAAVTRQGSQAYVFVRSRDGFTARPVTVSVAAGDQCGLRVPCKRGIRSPSAISSRSRACGWVTAAWRKSKC